MNKTKGSYKNLIWICMLLLILLCVMTGIYSIQSIYASTAEDAISNLTETQYPWTNTDSPNEIEIQKYGEKNFGKNATLSWDHSVWLGGKKITITGDDDIVKLIPKSLFQTVGNI